MHVVHLSSGCNSPCHEQEAHSVLTSTRIGHDTHVSVLQPAKEIRVPENQLQLTDAQLDEEVAKMLTANNPEAPKALVRYIQKERCYKPEAMIVQSMTHYAMDGWLLHRESEEAKKQQDQDKLQDELQRKFAADMEKAGADSGIIPPPARDRCLLDTHLTCAWVLEAIPSRSVLSVRSHAS
jgi:hypothetical protein